MEATVAKVRDYVRRQLSGERVWRVGVVLTLDSARVTIHTPEKPDKFTAERDKKREPLIDGLQRGLNGHFAREFKVEVVQAPTAVARYIRISGRKVRFVADEVRGKSVQDALAILQFVPNSAAKTLSKLIKSAVANAENNHRMDGETLELMHVHVDDGPSMKRVSQRAQGRAYRIVKRTSHITIGLAESGKVVKTERGKGVARTVSKTTRRPKAVPAGTKRADTADSAAKKASEPEKAKAPRRQARKGGE
jgi:large subunit ribosomal protein L22